MAHIHNLLPLPFMFVAGNFAVVLNDLIAHPSKDRGPIVIIILRPTIRRMVVAFRALQPGSKENLGGCFASRDGIAVGTIIIGGGSLVSAAPRRNQFTHELIERFVRGNAVANPALKMDHAFLIK